MIRDSLISVNRKWLSAAVLFHALCMSPVWAQVQYESAAFHDTTCGEYDRFGEFVAVSNNTAVIGARAHDVAAYNSGTAYVFRFNGSAWTSEGELTPLDGAASDDFGYTVAISGDVCVVGTLGKSAAYVFRRSGSVWSQEAKLVKPNTLPGGGFGYAVALSGGTLAVACGDNEKGYAAGAVYVFEYAEGQWVPRARLIASDGMADDRLGTALAISGDTIVAGAFYRSSQRGAAYVFQKPAGGWTDTTEVARLLASNGGGFDQFGYAVAVSGNTVVVGAPWVASGAMGTVYVFEKPASGWANMTETTFLHAADSSARNEFGCSVGISSGTLVVGAHGDQSACPTDPWCGSGAAYIFRYNGSAWNQYRKLLASDASAGDRLGMAVAVEGNSVLAGANGKDVNNVVDCGMAYGYQLPPQADCNNNQVPDVMDIAQGTSHDCNNNGVPDECDISQGTSVDCNHNGFPDDCDVLAADCNHNGVPDDCEIAECGPSAPRVLNGDANTDSFTDAPCQLITDRQGHWLAVWMSNDTLGGTLGTDWDVLVARSTDSGQSWTYPAALNTTASSDGGASDREPQLATDEHGNWLAVWSSDNGLGGTIGADFDILLSRSSDDGATWSTPQPLNTDAGADIGDDVWPQIACDGQGHWVAVWGHYSVAFGAGGPTGNADMVTSWSDDNGLTWSSPSQINGGTLGAPGAGQYPRLVTDRQGNWVTVWQSNDGLGGTTGTDWDILFSRSSDNGVTWTLPAPVNTNATADAGNDYSPDLATDGRGNWVVVWSSNDRLGGVLAGNFHILSSRATANSFQWTLSLPIKASAAKSSDTSNVPQIATDGWGNWVVAWIYTDGAPNSVFNDTDVVYARSVDAGASWGASAILNTDANTDILPDYDPYLTTDGNGNWVAMWWSQKNIQGNGNDLDILYTCFRLAPADCNQNGIHDSVDVASGASQDCNHNGIPDECDSDCNLNGVPDECDIAAGTSSDNNANAVPDECEQDCNANGSPDMLDIRLGRSLDCNANTTPDECDIADGLSLDCNLNGTPDECETDCNHNHVPDDCDLSSGSSADVDADDIPDDCEADCNGNQIPDHYEVSSGASPDCNGNGTPDECDPLNVAYVNAGATGLNTGANWANAFNNLQDALAIAGNACRPVSEIWVAAGTYWPDRGRGQTAGNRHASFTLVNGLSLYGGFSPGEVGRDARRPSTNVTILSGDLGIVGESADNSYHVVTITNADTGAVLDGFSIRGGNANGGSYPNERDWHGGGVYCENARAQIVNCAMEYNQASMYGGGAYCNYSSPTITNCTVSGNVANYGAGLCWSYGQSGYAGSLEIQSCTIYGNTAAFYGGGIACENAPGSPGHEPRISNSVLWGNTAINGAQISLRVSSFDPRTQLTVSDSLAQGGQAAAYLPSAECTLVWSSSDGQANPFLTADGHLQAGSSCRESASAGAGPASDRDGESRPQPAEGRADIGCDEFLDTDSDGLPDWWEQKYFNSPTAADANANPDGDGLSNLLEYEEYSSNPVAAPRYVDAANAADPTQDGTTAHPFGTLQQGLNGAADADTVLVAPGAYAVPGHTGLDYALKAVILRSQQGPTTTVIDCGSSGRAVNVDSIKGTFAVIEGFTIQNGHATDNGGGIRADQSRLMVRNCRLTCNTAGTSGGAFYSDLGSPTISDLTIDSGNSEPAGVISRSNVNLTGALTLAADPSQTREVESRSSWFYGPGAINVGAGTTFRITGTNANDPPSVMQSTISGLGRLLIDPGQQLTLAGQAVLDMSDGQEHSGTVTVRGRLVAQDQATIRHSDLTVHQAQITTSEPIQYNNVHMQDAVGYGGEIFVKDNARIIDNHIISEGDRYLDLDPDPSLPAHPTIDHNVFKVKIATSPALPRGTLLELRAKDFDAGTQSNPEGRSGVWQTSIGDRFDTEPAQNWVLDTLEIQPGSRVSLTNRAGFQYRTDTTHPETVYVKTVKLHPGAVLNTGLQALYYESLVDENGDPLDPNDLTGDRKIVDEPLLGFRLGLIGMNDMESRPGFNEFDIRIRQRLRDPSDVQDCRCDGVCPNDSPPRDTTACLQGSILRIADARAAGDGVMEMRTQAENRESASSVAAKGSFARAGEENIVVVFEHRFIDAGDVGDAEIVVKLSDNQEVAVGNLEVARLKPPAAGLPGAVGSSDYAVFYLVVPYNQWKNHLTKFVRGTYVELELRGKGAVVDIDNWDPQVICGDECASFDGVPGVTEADFLILLAQYGRSVAADASDACMDVAFSRAHYIEISDLLSWDAYVAGGLDSCGMGGVAANVPRQNSQGKLTTSSQPPTANALLVCGKSNVPGQQADGLYTMTDAGDCSTSDTIPAGGSNSRANGRLIRDGSGKVYQLHGMNGLVRLEDEHLVLAPRGDLNFNGNTVLVGVTITEYQPPPLGSSFVGLPLSDAAFDPHDSTIVYVAPVVVVAPDSHTYKAVARLQLGSNAMNHELQALYGMDPCSDPMVLPNPPEASPYTVQKIRELEIDRSGSTLYVISSDGLQVVSPNGTTYNEWLLAFNTSTGNEKTRQRLTELDASLRSPTAMLASSREDKLYLTSTVGTPAQVFRLNVSHWPPTYEGAIATTARQITAISENPTDGKLYAVGLQFPQEIVDLPEDLSRTDPRYAQYFSNTSPVFAMPNLFAVVPAATWPSSVVTAQPVAGSDLALPTAAVYIPGVTHPADFNNDGGVDLADLEIFIDCARGPASPYVIGCGLADFDTDGDVDATDFAEFQREWSPQVQN